MKKTKKPESSVPGVRMVWRIPTRRIWKKSHPLDPPEIYLRTYGHIRCHACGEKFSPGDVYEIAGNGMAVKRGKPVSIYKHVECPRCPR